MDIDFYMVIYRRSHFSVALRAILGMELGYALIDKRHRVNRS
jgi:hypothetical protein